MSRMAVGIDGSAEAKRALRWVADEARLRGAELDAVHVRAFPHIASGLAIEPMLEPEVIATVRRVAQDVVDNELDKFGDAAAESTSHA